MADDEYYMRQALNIAAYAKGRTSPNPLVGAVIVRDGRIVGQGWHRCAGTAHAEINALQQAGELAAGADIYVTLEPCSHYGRTPPCADALIRAGIRRVVIAAGDPNPLVAGRGIERLRAAGIEVVENVLAEQARRQNEVFFKWVVSKRPFMIMKSAMTLDGKTAAVSGQSQWISGETSRQFVHRLRDVCDGIMVGIGTVLKDDPRLTTRLADDSGRSPVRIIVDSRARLPLDSAVVTDRTVRTLVAVTKAADRDRAAALQEAGCELIQTEAGADGEVALPELLQALGEQNICSVLLEGGATLNDAFLRAGLIDKVYVFIAPKLLGGAMSPTAVGGQGIAALSDAVQLENMSAVNLGGDLLVTGYVRRN